jgi:hypothetical protein
MKKGRCLIQAPTMLAMVNHLAGHAAVYADIFSGNETGFGGA